MSRSNIDNFILICHSHPDIESTKTFKKETYLFQELLTNKASLHPITICNTDISILHLNDWYFKIKHEQPC